MASIKVQYLGNEGGNAVVKYGLNTYYCRFGAFGDDDLIVGNWYSVDHSELKTR